MKANFACYRCPGDCCCYLGGEEPPTTCPKHGSEALVGIGYGGKHYEVIEVDPAKAHFGWVCPGEQYESDLFGGAA